MSKPKTVRQMARMLEDFKALERRVSEQDQLLAKQHKELLRKRLHIEDLKAKLKKQEQRNIELNQLLHDLMRSHKRRTGSEISSHFVEKINHQLAKS